MAFVARGVREYQRGEVVQLQREGAYDAEFFPRNTLDGSQHRSGWRGRDVENPRPGRSSFLDPFRQQLGITRDIGTKLGVDWKRENIQRCEDGQWLKKLAHVPSLREGSAPASGLPGYSRPQLWELADQS